MNISKYMSTFQGLKIEAHYNRYVTVGLLALVFCLTFWLAHRPTIVTIQPWTLSEDAQVTREDASRSYLEAWGFALSELVGNVTPANSKFISDRIKPLLAPSIYHKVVEGLEANVNTLNEERITLRFEPRSVLFEKSTGKVFVSGMTYTRLASSLEVERSEERTYEFTLKIANYAPLILDINTYAGKPRTRQVLETLRESEAARNAKEREEIAERARYIEPKAETGLHSEADRKIQ